MSITIGAPAGYAIEPIETSTASADIERQVVGLMQAIEHEEVPEDPEPPYQPLAAQFRMRSPFREQRWFGAFTGGRLVGGAMLGIDKSGSNANLRQCAIRILPAHRGKGLGRALFARLVAEIGEGEGILLNMWTSSRIPSGPAFAAHVGAKDALHMRTNQLDVATVDRALMHRWASLDPKGYRLEWVTGDTPERLMGNVIAAMEAMNAMPHEGLQVEDWKVTPEIVRDREHQRRARGHDHWMLLAVDESTGKTASFTEVNVDPLQPHLIWQGGTATIPEHRGKGLGKWVKGRMMVRILDELPAVRYVRTGNAGSNAAMLAINEQMGFRHVWDNIVWQMPLETAQRYVRR